MKLIAAYAEGISELTRYSKKAEEMPLLVDIIVNPHAGFYRKKQKLKKIIAELEGKLAELHLRYPKRKIELKTVHFTQYPGQAREITLSILNQEARQILLPYCRFQHLQYFEALQQHSTTRKYRYVDQFLGFGRRQSDTGIFRMIRLSP